jgi:hypothetical protein
MGEQTGAENQETQSRQCVECRNSQPQNSEQVQMALDSPRLRPERRYETKDLFAALATKCLARL